ncbi:uncharacterized protein LOC116363038 isoform X3 [Oncorhynchus kisutch]|nr:uncharacterized protein LOC116363038 isoform X3 [Oncorhynchus kisutch]
MRTMLSCSWLIDGSLLSFFGSCSLVGVFGYLHARLDRPFGYACPSEQDLPAELTGAGRHAVILLAPDKSDLPWPHHMSQLLLLWREGDTTTGQPLHLSLEIELQTPSKTTEPFNTPREFMMHTLRGRRNRITPSTITKTQRRMNYPIPSERERVTSVEHSQKEEVEEAFERGGGYPRGHSSCSCEQERAEGF